MFAKEFIVIKWKCKRLGKNKVASANAVYHKKHGWLCDCGYWVKDDIYKHIPIEEGWRWVFE